MNILYNSKSWYIIAEYESISEYYDDLEITRLTLEIEQYNWNVVWFTRNNLFNSSNIIRFDSKYKQVDCIYPDNINNIVNKLSRLNNKNNIEIDLTLWFLYDYDDGFNIIKYFESSISAKWNLICPTAESYFISSSKLLMKDKFKLYNIPTAKWTTVSLNESTFTGSWFIKPIQGAASQGQLEDNHVKDAKTMEKVWKRVELFGLGVFAEHFIEGREASVLVAGNKDNSIAFSVVERVFKSGISGFQIDDVWDNFHFQVVPDDDKWAISCKQLALDAYYAVGCYPYARVDIRGNYVLEVNAVPSYSLLNPLFTIPNILKQDPVQWKLFWQYVWDGRRIIDTQKIEEI